jgi:hypothetical protein
VDHAAGEIPMPISILKLKFGIEQARVILSEE